MSDPIALIALKQVLPFLENDLSALAGPTISKIGVHRFCIIEQDDTLAIQVSIESEQVLLLEVPSLPGFGFVFDIEAGAEPALLAELYPQLGLRISGIDLGIRFPNSLFKPMTENPDGTFAAVVSDDGKPAALQININDVDFGIDSNGNIDFTLFDELIALKFNYPFMIADTGIIIDAGEITISTTKGFEVSIPKANVYLPGGICDKLLPTDLELKNSIISSGGFNGQITSTWSDLNPITTQFFGVELKLNKVSLEFKQNTLINSEITGKLKLPFFDEYTKVVEIGIDISGRFIIKLADDKGLSKVSKPDILEIELDSLGFEVDKGKFIAKLSGEITPLFGKNQGLKWPSFQVKELTIDSDGNVHLEGGWMDLPNQYCLDFHGFKMEITKLGFGKTEDGGKWIGFSGSLKLVEGLQAGASVEGLRITWYDDDDSKTKISLNGVGVEFEVPEVLRFKGAVSYRELPEDIHRFDGAIKLELLTLDMEIDGQLVVGFDKKNNYTFFYIFLEVDLPAGIPLWSTGVALYGMSGLFALKMVPNKGENKGWYENLDGTNGWYKEDPIGITALSKWINNPKGLAVGAGVTIGTVSDNGYTISAKAIFVISFPGPIIMIEGRASLLKERAKLDEGEPVFRALAVLDSRAGTFLLNVDAQYKYDDEGRLIEIHGGAEAFFSFVDASAWHLYLGQKEPREKRIRALIFRLYESNSYFMLDANKLALGSWIGYDAHWKFGPLKVTLEAWIEENAVISWKPVRFHGDLWLHGKAELKVFWFGLGMSVDARLAADVFDPFHLLAELSVGIDLPWFLPDFDVTITLEWGPEPIIPPIPLPLKEIAVEHLKVTTSWPLPRGSLLLPNYDDGNGFHQDPQGAIQPNLDEIPVVPMDCRPHITFGRPVNDDAMVGVNVQPGNGEWERIGDPAKNEGPVLVRYGLEEIALEKLADGKWAPAASKGTTPNPADIPTLYGSWAPIPAMPDNGGKAVAQTKLWIWSKTPFDYGSPSWIEWFADRFGSYPCVLRPEDQVTCYDFEKLNPDLTLTSPWAHPDDPGLVFYWDNSIKMTIKSLQDLVQKRGKGLSPRNVGAEITSITVKLPKSAKEAGIIFSGIDLTRLEGHSDDGKLIGEFEIVDDNLRILKDKKIKYILLEGYFAEISSGIVAVCATVGPDEEEISSLQKMGKHLVEEIARWSQEDNVLEPYATYRLRIVTTIEARGEGELADYSKGPEKIEEYAYFRTAGPVGLARELSVPKNNKDSEKNMFKSGLEDLTPYVRQTLPATVQAKGQKPFLPKPIYRAYDVSVEFNENYVDLMYRLAWRDLKLYLYNSNNYPVHDAQGRLVVLNSNWQDAEELKLTDTEKTWVKKINASKCVSDDEKFEQKTKILPDKNLICSAEGQVLDPDSVYEARLVPLLLHEAFSKDMTGWKSYDVGPAGSLWKGHKRLKGKAATVAADQVHLDGSLNLLELFPGYDILILEDVKEQQSGIYKILSINPGSQSVKVEGQPKLKSRSSRWEIPDAIVQTSQISMTQTILIFDYNPRLPKDHLDQPINWTDYRVCINIRSEDVPYYSDNNAFGIVFRFKDSLNYYVFRLSSKDRRLYKNVDGVPYTLARDELVYSNKQNYFITIEAIGSSLIVHQDGVLVFEVTDRDAIKRGSFGYYCWQHNSLYSNYICVDDLRKDAPIVYRFRFTTSKFANFFHHLHSFRDETWRVKLSFDAAIPPVIARAVKPAEKPTDAEHGDYDKLETLLLEQLMKQKPPGICQNPLEIQVSRIEIDGEAAAFLVQSPEPIDWERTTIELLHSGQEVSKPKLSGSVKFTNVTFGKNQPNEESVTLLLLESADLAGYRIDYRPLPGDDKQAEVIWEPYYTFKNETPMSAGTKVRVFAGDESNAMPNKPGEVYRFIASRGEEGQLRIPAKGVDLRLVTPNGTFSHIRSFIPNESYHALSDTGILRKADGTGFFMLVLAASSAGSRLEPGQYRLQLKYRRDNRDAHPDSQVFRQAGNKDDEYAIIDIPWEAN